MVTYIDALKLYNNNKGKWQIPKRGTTEYIEVMKIYEDLKKDKSTEPKKQPNPKKEPKPKQPKQPKQ